MVDKMIKIHKNETISGGINMGVYYHGSIVKGLIKLMPKYSEYSKLNFPCVYLTENIQIATLYIWDKPYKWMSYGFKDGIPFYTETFENALYEFYNNINGCIYEVNGTFDTNELVGILYTTISKEPINIIKQYFVENVYEKLLKYEKEQKIIIKRYNELTEKDTKIRNKMILAEIKNNDLKNKMEDPLSKMIREKFPEIWNMKE
jgi:hypothetical protein